MQPHIQHSSSHHPTSHHSYGTRIRKNSVLKPSARLRQCPSPPCRIKPLPIPPIHQPACLTPDPCFPTFPLPGVMLHPEDASNKVFHAIGRSFLSVENRAMTIKDLAEMTLSYGLMCQNVSAASQAITTYIRNHMARCEAQQDHPLLLRHVLSGTLADDDLVPALYSRRGGATNLTKSNSKDSGLNDKNVVPAAQGALEGEWLTNFRRGTMVWYLSKAAGVSCPFARAGIRLCEYGKEGRKVAEVRLGPKAHIKREEAQCGEKRKRVRRSCRRDSDSSRKSSGAGRDSKSPAIDSGYSELSADSSDDERPPKVKLTLRLRPSLPCAPTTAVSSCPNEVIDLSSDVTGSSSEDEVGADNTDGTGIGPDPSEVPWSLPPYPRRSVSVPCYTPACDERAYSPLFSTQQCMMTDEERRSPSVPWSATPPPDSDHDDFDLDLDSDIDWDSSSLSVPSPAPAPRVKVEVTDVLQRERADICDMLDAWEDLDCASASAASSATVKLPTSDDFKFDALELWEWEYESGWSDAPVHQENQQDLPIAKVEPEKHEYLTSFRVLAPVFPIPPYSSFASPVHNSLSFPTSELGVDSFASQFPLPPFTLPTSPSPPSFRTGINKGGSALTWQDAELLGPDSVRPHEFEDGWVSGVRTHVDCNLLPQPASDGVGSPSSVDAIQENVDIARTAVKEPGTCRIDPSVRASYSPSPNVAVVVHTCRPCTPDICATQIEGISVYQTMLGSTLLLRRIDTDFVNFSTILAHLSLSPPLPLPNTCVNVSHPSLAIDGIWAPLSVARSFAHGLPKGIESIFLSDDLVMCFPTALQDFYQESASGRSLNQFGPQFNASVSSPKARSLLHIPQFDHGRPAKEDTWETFIETGLIEEPSLAIPPSVNIALAALHPSASNEVPTSSLEIPLSPTEQEIFRTLCVHPDWDTEDVATSRRGEMADTVPQHTHTRDKPLRRSRRVANAVAARSRAAPPRTKGPRHS